MKSHKKDSFSVTKICIHDDLTWLHPVYGKTFSHTPDEAMSDGLAKACDLGKMYSVEENISYFIENQTE